MKTLKLLQKTPILIGMFLAFCVNQSIVAQVVYTDVKPDKIYKCSKSGCRLNYSLDLNNDGVADFNVICYSYPPSKKSKSYNNAVLIRPLNNNSVSSNDPPYYGYGIPLASGTLINSDLNWASSANSYILGWTNLDCFEGCGNPICDVIWPINVDKYLGLKLIVGNFTFYGWVRLSVDVPCGKPLYASFTIKDYAYESTPDRSIVAGATTGSISSRKLSDGKIENKITNRPEINVYPNPISNATNISFSLSQSENISLKIFDLNGRLIKNLADKIFEAGENNVEWNADGLSSGIYLLQFQTAENKQTKKLIISR